MAVHLGWSPTRTRVLALVLVLAGGAGLLLYLWLWAVVPLAEPTGNDDGAITRSVPVAAGFVALASISAVMVLFSLTPEREVIATRLLIGVTLFAGAAVAWSLAFDRTDPARSGAYGTWIRSIAVILLGVAGIAVLLSRPSALNAVLGVGMLVLAAGVLAAPRVVALWSELVTERTTRARQEQRAEIAAHLHDSVLQTLALIQNRSGASSEVARIARAQERELRDWLFAGDAPGVADLATELRHTAGVIELDHAVRIDVVTAGEVLGVSNSAMMAAAREAMLNAARHAGGDVSVYLEVAHGGIDIFVRDRGPGVALDSLPGDRLGIRESIIGRMTRAGGTATVRPGAGGGTEVHLHLENPHD